MRRIAVINQKGGVGKTTTCANLGAALARLGRRVVLIDMDAQANLAMHLACEVGQDEPSTYSVLTGKTPLAEALRETATPNLRVVPSHLELSGAELELASTFGRETLMRVAVEDWIEAARKAGQAPPADYLIFDCPPSLGLPSVNALAASTEVLIAMQTEFFALQGMSTLVEVVELLKRRVNPALDVTGILPCLYDARLKLAREVIAEIRTYFPGKVFRTAIRTNVKLAESPSFGQTIFEYAPSSPGAADYRRVAEEVLEQEAYHPELEAPPRTAWQGAEMRAPTPAFPAAPAPPPPAAEVGERVVELQPLPPPPVARPTSPAGSERGPVNLVAPESALEPEADPEPDPESDPEPEPAESQVGRWVRDALPSGQPAQPLPPAHPSPKGSPEPRDPRSEPTYVLQPSPPPTPDPSGGRRRESEGRSRGGVRPNDLMSLCLRSLRSLWS